MLKKQYKEKGLIGDKDDFANFSLNEKALMDNLKWSEKQLKMGVPLEIALNEANLAFGNMSESERIYLRDKLKPYPTRPFIRKLDSLIKKYGKN